MSVKLKYIISATATILFATQGQATTFTFEGLSSDIPTNGTLVFSTDYYNNDNNDDPLKWSKDGLGLSAWGGSSDGDNGGGDNDNEYYAAFQDRGPATGGLGVIDIDEQGNLDGSSDNIDGADFLRLTFSTAVSLNGLDFNGNHVEFGLGEGVEFKADDTWYTAILGVSGWDFDDGIIATNFRFFAEGHATAIRKDLDTPESFYLASINVQIPEPSSLALLALGVAGLGASRRRTKS